MSDRSDPARLPEAPPAASPFRLNLGQQRKRAKELLAALRADDPEAWRRFRAHHPRGEQAATLRLSEAQLVIARELGLPSWPRLKAHVEAMKSGWARIRQGEAAPDRGMATLHIRCGSDIAPTLRQAGFRGDFLEYSDPLCQGPVLQGPGWKQAREAFLLQAYGEGSGMDRATIAAKLRREEEGLAAAAERHERIVLWFEHDSYDQLILARCLAAFAERSPSRLELVSPARYPGGARFIGLGQLPPEALLLLWETRAAVPDEALQAGQAVWAALRAPDPSALAALAMAGTPGLPQLGRAVRRHCQELPWTSDGLGLMQRLTLQLLAEAPHRLGLLFHRLMTEREPLPWMSDLIFRDIIEGMRRVRSPVFTAEFERPDGGWAEERLSITKLGRAVLAGEVDWLSLQPPARHVGGVPILGGAPCWRWDEELGTVARR